LIHIQETDPGTSLSTGSPESGGKYEQEEEGWERKKQWRKVYATGDSITEDANAEDHGQLLQGKLGSL